MILYSATTHATAAGKPFRFKVMTFNVKYASESENHRWSDRRPVLRNAILRANPDLIGTQEGLHRQATHIAEDLPGYDWIGLGRDGGSKGELMAIFYKRRRFEPLAYDHFWLSDTPQVIGSRTWGHDSPRMVTWVLFRDKASAVEFYHWNTHFDNQSEAARHNSADLVLGKLRSTDPDRPAVVTGDFNAAQTSIVHEKMLARAEGQVNLLDAWDEAEVREGKQVCTCHGWSGPSDSDQRIDWVLTSPDFKCKRAAVITYQENGRYPSDHFPVVCDLVVERPA
jgi:endonuclease/exonuclease/phosphatase family metal-dependent hydrolase